MSRIRKQWLTSFITYLSVCSAYFLLSLIDATEGVQIETYGAIIRIIIWGSITYHCAYQTGTKWLMWTLISLTNRLNQRICRSFNGKSVI